MRLHTHRFQYWNGRYFRTASLWETGLVLNLGHNGSPCPNFAVFEEQENERQDASSILFTPPLIPAGIRRNPGIPSEWTGFRMDSYPFRRNSKEKLHYTKQINHIQKKLP